MNTPQTVPLSREVDAAIVPTGTRVRLQAGETARITQALGGSYTVVVNGNLFRIAGHDADALGLTPDPGAPAPTDPAPPAATGASILTREEVERRAWEALKTCYDPEIPVNIVDLGLIYECRVEPIDSTGTFRIAVRMTLTAPGCGMGPVLQQDVQTKLLALETVDEVQVDLVWEPMWNQGMMSEAARLELGLY